MSEKESTNPVHESDEARVVEAENEAWNKLNSHIATRHPLLGRLWSLHLQME